MTVYVDDMRRETAVGRLRARWSHLIVGPFNPIEELHGFAAKIGLKRSWFQDKASGPHYDVTDSKRVLAIQRGATPITWRETGEMMLRWSQFRRRDERTRKILAGCLPGGLSVDEALHELARQADDLAGSVSLAEAARVAALAAPLPHGFRWAAAPADGSQIYLYAEQESGDGAGEGAS